MKNKKNTHPAAADFNMKNTKPKLTQKQILEKVTANREYLERLKQEEKRKLYENYKNNQEVKLNTIKEQIYGK